MTAEATRGQRAGAQLDMVGLMTALRANAQNRARLDSRPGAIGLRDHIDARGLELAREFGRRLRVIEAALPKPLAPEVAEALHGDGSTWGES